jgi:hypothetical protein
VVIPPLEGPGFITLESDGRVTGRLAVNPDCADESTLEYMDPGVFADSIGLKNVRVIESGDEISERIKQARYGHEITGPVMIAALIVFIIELLVAQGAAGRGRDNVE